MVVFVIVTVMIGPDFLLLFIVLEGIFITIAIVTVIMMVMVIVV